MNIEFLTLKEVAEILKVTPVHVQNLIHSGKLKGFKFENGRAMRVQMVYLVDYIGGSQVVTQEQVDMATNYYERAMDRATTKKITILQAVEELRAEDPSGYKIFMDLSLRGIQKSDLRFDNPVSESRAAAESMKRFKS
jgi:excisionase family DNA binding protein